MIRTKEEIVSAIRDRIGEDTGDEAIALLEDVTDTLDDLEARAADTTDWKQKYDELDQSWRQKYIDRFNGVVESDDLDENPVDDDNTVIEYEAPTTYEELFEVKED